MKQSTSGASRIDRCFYLEQLLREVAILFTYSFFLRGRRRQLFTCDHLEAPLNWAPVFTREHLKKLCYIKTMLLIIVFLVVFDMFIKLSSSVCRKRTKHTCSMV